MPHIDLPEGLPGILGPMAFRPDTAELLNGLAEVLLRGESTLSRGERELIAATVSRGNDCHFCSNSHGAFAAAQLDEGWDVVDATWSDPTHAPVSPKLQALLDVALAVREGGKVVSDELVAAARAQGATDRELHDTVLIAAAFCMYNRYVDGLATVSLPSREAFDEMAGQIVEHGYGMPEPATVPPA